MIKIKVFDIFQKEYEIHFPSNKVTPYLFIESLKKKDSIFQQILMIFKLFQ